MTDQELKALHLFCGGGGGALGFQQEGFKSVGAFDIDPIACEAYEYLTGDKATCADLASISPADLRAACSGRPDVVLTSPPCKSFSGCLPQAMADTEKYVDMSSLALRGIFLAVEAWETPPPLILMENVPRITTRGAHWLEQLEGLLHGYGYALDKRVHDVGELGGLGQRRRRFLLMARHMKQCPVNLFLPALQPLKSIGDVIGELPVPLPGSSEGGPMHRLPRLSAMNWVRLALIPAGGDWRDLPESVAIVAGPNRHHGGYGVNDWDGQAKTVVGATDPRQKPVSVADPRLGDRAARQNGGFGVNDGEEPSHAVVAEGTVRNTWASVTDPRISTEQRSGSYGVSGFDDPAHAVLAHGSHDNSRSSIADPRVNGSSETHNGRLGVESWQGESHTVTGRNDARTTWGSVADPRSECIRRDGAMGITSWRGPSTTVIGRPQLHNGPWQTTDPRISGSPHRHNGKYGVQEWAQPSHAIISEARIGKGGSGVQDPRIPELVGPEIDLASKRPVYLIIEAADGTWHRPLTTLELAALQSFPVWHRGGWLKFNCNDAQCRQLIGNAIPPKSARVMARAAAAALSASRDGRTFLLSSDEVWVRKEVELRS